MVQKGHFSFRKQPSGTLCVVGGQQGWFFVSREKKKKSTDKSIRFVVSIPFEVEIESRGPYIACDEVDLADLGMLNTVGSCDDPVEQSDD